MLFDKGYAGDLSSTEAWRFLAEDPEALLIDVRTVAEWVYVGLPDISRLGRSVVCVVSGGNVDRDVVARALGAGTSP